MGCVYVQGVGLRYLQRVLGFVLARGGVPGLRPSRENVLSHFVVPPRPVRRSQKLTLGVNEVDFWESIKLIGRPINFIDSQTQPFHEVSPTPWQQRSPLLSRGRCPPLIRR